MPPDSREQLAVERCDYCGAACAVVRISDWEFDYSCPKHGKQTIRLVARRAAAVVPLAETIESLLERLEKCESELYREKIATQTAVDERDHWRTVAFTLDAKIKALADARALQTELPTIKQPRKPRESARGRVTLFSK